MATLNGSERSSAAGLPVSIWQKSQRRVHSEPPMRNEASRSSQHSKMFGFFADGVQSLGLHQVFQPHVFRTDVEFRLDPLGLALHGYGGVALFNAQ